MCRIDYAESNGEVCMTPPTLRNARKDHRCNDCGRTIGKGERYTYAAWVGGEWDGWSICKVCEQCVEAGRWLNKVCGGHFMGDAIDELREHWDEEPDMRSNGLGWLITAASQHWQRNGRLVPVPEVSRWVDKALAKVPTAAVY